MNHKDTKTQRTTDLNRRSFVSLCLCGSIPLLASCGGGPDTRNKEIVVYSPHGQYLEGDVKTRFEAANPGYTILFQDMGGGKILAKIDAEKDYPRADVWWGGSPEDFNRGVAAGLLEPYAPEWTKNLPADAKHPDGMWVATFRTPEIIMYNPKKIAAADVPKTWDALLEPQWKGRIAIRDVMPSTTMRTIFGALILRAEAKSGSLDAGFDFLRKLDANTGTYAANPQVLYELMSADGPYALTLWNLPDVMKEKERYPLEFVVPPETPVIAEPIAIVKGAKNPEGARLFHDFVNKPEQLELMAKERFRIPARTDLAPEKLPPWIRELKLQPMALDTAKLQKNLDDWILKWDREIKGKGK